MTTAVPPSFTTSILWTTALFSASVWLIVHLTARRILKKRARIFSFLTAVGLLVWFLAVFFLGKMGFFAINPLVAPNIILAFLFLFIVIQKVYASPRIQAVADAIPVHWIVATQTYRIVGWGFLLLYQQGLLPAEFAFPAGIGDMVVGIAAPFVAYAYWKKYTFAPRLATLWNIVGIADLVLAISIGILGYPRPLQWLPTAPSTDLFSLYPLVFISLFSVPLALLLHFFSLRAIKKRLCPKS